MRVGIAVYCAECRNQKAPVGRSVPMGSFYCDDTCRGYSLQPYPGSLFPGETEEDFGYPVGQAGTVEAEPRKHEGRVNP